jgi:cation diffusion facilitator CzcD-associated flavoprotein CzcO
MVGVMRTGAAARSTETVLIGAGPAGFAFLSAAERMGMLGRLTRGGLTVVDSSSDCTGALHRYEVAADTPARVFQETLQPLLSSRPELGRTPPLQRLFDRAPDEKIRLSVAADAIQVATNALLDRVRREGGRVLQSVEVVAARPASGGVHLTARDVRARTIHIRVQRAIFATGGTPAMPHGLTSACPGAVHADWALSQPELRFPRSVRKVAIIGSSHSAFAVVARLQRTLLRDGGEIAVHYRTPPRATYESAEQALADGAVLTADDVCPQTGRVFRFGGLRMEAAAAFRAVRDGRCPRVALVDISSSGLKPTQLCRGADLVVAATGYRNKSLDILRVPGARWDARCRLVDLRGRAVPGLYGIGLASRPRVLSDGGEPSFHGAVDEVWFYDRVVAPIILDQLLAAT